MALKGFLASGFQKLIGASRIKGADESWLGEHNVQTVSSNTVPIAATLAPGFNIINYTGTSDFNFTGGASALFATNPTQATQVMFRNSSPSSKLMTFESAILNGGLNLHAAPLVLNPGGSVTFWYDATTQRWREACRTGYDGAVFTQTLSATGGLQYTGDEAERIFILDRSGTSTIYVTGCSPYGLLTPVGRKITIIGAPTLSTTYPLIVQQSATANNSAFLLNGDFELSKYSSITMVQSGDGWVEVSRTNLSY